MAGSKSEFLSRPGGRRARFGAEVGCLMFFVELGTKPASAWV